MSGTLVFEGGYPLFVGGLPAMSLACCCTATCCCERLRGVSLTCEMQWGCPAEANPAAISFSLPWDETDNCWRGTKTGWCTSPADFTVEAVCGTRITPAVPGPETIVCNTHTTLYVRIKATSNSGWRSADTDTDQAGCFNYTWVDVFDGVLGDSSCCTISPGALTYLKLIGTP